MAGDWETVSLGHICTGIYDGPHATPPPSETGAVFLRIENITPSGRLDFSDIRRINDADWGRWTRRITPQSDDVVFSYEANLGLFARIPPGFHGCLGRRLALMRPDPLQVDAGYLLYACLAPEFQELLRQRTVLGSTVDRISLREFPTFEIPLPPLPEQKRIAHILGTLDDKIELNRRTNATLEAMSRAIFKSWFVDFDPVRQKAAGKQPVGMDAQTAALFPDSFEDSEIGEVPKGWGVGRLGDVAEHPRRAARPGEIPVGTPYIGLEHMPRRCIALSEWGEGDVVESNKFEFQRGEILFGKLRPYFHKVGVAPVDGVCSTDIVVARARSPEWFGFALGVMSSDEFVAHTNAGSTGTKMPRTNWDDMSRYEAVLPSESVADAFTSVVQPAVASIAARIHQSRALAALRDTLLPKLLSGEVRVPEAEGMVEEAIR